MEEARPRMLRAPNVVELAKQKVATIPLRYIHEDIENTTHSSSMLFPQVPDIDMEKLLAIETIQSLRGFILHAENGDFSSSSLVEKVKSQIKAFFDLPMEEKKKFEQQEGDLEGYGQAFVVSEEQELDWADMLYMITLPAIGENLTYFLSSLSHLDFRDLMEAYCKEIQTLAMIIICQLAKALSMDEKEMRDVFVDGVQSMRMNYYPPCPEPGKTYGLNPHSDTTAFTILLQLNETEGPQVRKDNIWVPIKPLPNAFIVNIGDMIEILSNGVYRSIEHRAVVNSNQERPSLAAFYTFNPDIELGPARSLTGPQ
ncbi:putative protein SRG1-like [Capsicum annuum]|nr:putative protein SRG1-like [Capsicum annuum]KAF3666074.1 putative protein SRG1-like [Capsicum annuum]